MGWVRVVGAALAKSVQDDLLDWGATLAFYFLFALFPTVLLVAALLAAFHMKGLVGNLVAALTQNLPKQAASLVSGQLGQLLERHVPGLINLDIVILFYSASQGFSGLMTALNVAYEVSETRSYLHRLALAFALTFSAGIFIALALALLLLGERSLTLVAGRAHLSTVLRLFWPWIRWAAALVLLVLALRMLYRYAPNRPQGRERGTLPAVAIAMGIWVAASALLGLYINHFATYSAVYGSLGAVIALMLWFYVFALAILLGAEIHHAFLKSRADILDHGPKQAPLH
ncbi:MAG: YihY/virulence factor BrkB family protein [Terriglobales bacterium]